MASNGWYKLEEASCKPGGPQKERNRPLPAEQRAGQPPKAKAPGQEPPARRMPPPPPRQMASPKKPPRPAQRMNPSIPGPRSLEEPPAQTPSSRVETRDTATKHSQTIGTDGPVVVQDTRLHETLEAFIHTKPLERAVHVKGFGAFGYFQLTNSMADYTTAPLFQTPGRQTPVLTRFSLAVSTKGTPDSGRNVRGFSTKFYMDDGVFDLLCNHIPVFLVRDAIRFPESINAFLPSPVNNLMDPERFWGFVARSPEATNFVTWLYSDVGTIKSLRRIRGYSVNTYVWKNKLGERRYVKYHWIPLAGEEYITRQEAGKLAGENPDVCGQDLYDSIAKGVPVEYDLCVQLMDPQTAQELPYDPLDCSKVWDETKFPLLQVGRLSLNRNPQDYAEQIEKVAFSPANLMEGVELSNDKMLQGRSFIYWDAQRRRLGPEFRKIPVNHQEGWNPDQVHSSGIGQFAEGLEMRSELTKPDDFTQAGERYRGLSEEEQEHLVGNIATELQLVSRETQNTVLGHFQQADTNFAQRVYQQMKEYEAR